PSSGSRSANTGASGSGGSMPRRPPGTWTGAATSVFPSLAGMPRSPLPARPNWTEVAAVETTVSPIANSPCGEDVLTQPVPNTLGGLSIISGASTGQWLKGVHGSASLAADAEPTGRQ